MKMKTKKIEKTKGAGRYARISTRFSASVTELAHFESVVVVHQGQKAMMIHALQVLQLALGSRGFAADDVAALIRKLESMGTIAEYHAVQESMSAILDKHETSDAPEVSRGAA